MTPDPVRTVLSSGPADVTASARSPKADRSDAVFKALADPSRRHLLDRLNARSGQNLGELCVGLHMARQSVSKHLAVLESAGLVTARRRGREKLHYLSAEPINEVFERWINPFNRDRVAARSDLKGALETTGVDRPAFTCTTYFCTTPEDLWAALAVYRRKGYHLTFHWLPRGSTTLNELVDHVSRCTRIRLQEQTLVVMGLAGVSPQHANP